MIKCGLPPAECEGSLLLDVAGRPVTIALKLGPKELVRGQETIGLPMIRPGDVVTVRYVRQGDELVARSVRVHPR
ncbi:MAG: hypothetical protein HYY85_14990 [Deltaproteobacteria bacterium]|nr:hypothetical protein [Deltaproteobacteria bacterium]